MAKFIVARRWRTPKSILVLFVLEFCLTIAALALFGIADPNLYRTKLWQAGADNGFNSNPNEILYAYANYRPIKVPLVWSQFVTSFNVVISVLSMFILLVKAVLFVMHIWFPLLSSITHAILCALWAVSTHAQVAADMSDKQHPQPGAPWYITKPCSAVHQSNLDGYCKQAKASFGVTVVMLALFAANLALAIYSTIPTSAEKRARATDLETAKIGHYSPERRNTTTTASNARASNQAAWKMNMQMRQQELLDIPGGSDAVAATPRTVAFRTLEGGSVCTGAGPSRSAGGALPFRERFDGPDGR